MDSLPGQAPGFALQELRPSSLSQAGTSETGHIDQLVVPATDGTQGKKKNMLLPAIGNYRQHKRDDALLGNPNSSTSNTSTITTPRYEPGSRSELMPPWPGALPAPALKAPVQQQAVLPAYPAPSSVLMQQGILLPAGQLSTVIPVPSAHLQPVGMVSQSSQIGVPPIQIMPQGVTPSPQAPVLSADGMLRLKVHVITYNMAGTLPVGQLPGMLFGDQNQSPADLYVIGTQESCALTEWDRLVSKSLGPSYVKKAQESLMAISLLVYAHVNLVPRITDIRTSSIACGIGNVLGNKGGVGVSCMIDGARLLLITSHLAAHDAFIDRRNADYQRIYTGLFSDSATTGNIPVAAPPGGSSGQVTPLRQDSPQRLGSAESGDSSPIPLGTGTNPRISRLAACSSMSQLPQPSSHSLSRGSLASMDTVSNSSNLGSPSVPLLNALSNNEDFSPFVVKPRQSALLLHDVVLWSGDLNYRINGADSAIRQLLGSDMIEVLHANDQLRIQMRKGKVFQGFHEQVIMFPPTFKYKPGSTQYSEKRIPSWTDRILHTAYADEQDCALEPLYYKDVPLLMDSDHRPVVGGYELIINPRRTGAPGKANANGSSCTIG